jgi:glycosyltransferase involved in cell wall biosynthesis
MRILHLAYEDPAQPGSGGGSVRTREINRRLSAHHEITALVAGYPGAKPYQADGIQWLPIGLRSGTKADRLTYFALLAPVLRRFSPDLVVEDFGAPFSVGFSPLFTAKPVVASVQWLFASQMRDKYHLPFDWIEQAGLRFYQDFIVVSDWLAAVLRKRRPEAKIETIPNGVEDAAFAVEPRRPEHLLFVGRLDRQQKGCDLLLEIVARTRPLLGEHMPPLIILGDGPDRTTLEQLTRQLKLDDIVQFRGRVEGATKYELMSSAYAVLMPSRFETFGMVAAESQAAGGPVIAFDVGPLGEVARPGGAYLVAPFDLDAFAQAIVNLVLHPAKVDHIRAVGRCWAKKYNWDQLAKQQEAHYIAAKEDFKRFYSR